MRSRKTRKYRKRTTGGMKEVARKGRVEKKKPLKTAVLFNSADEVNQSPEPPPQPRKRHKRNQTKRTRRADNTPMIIGGCIAGVIILFILIFAISGSSNKSKGSYSYDSGKVDVLVARGMKLLDQRNFNDARPVLSKAVKILNTALENAPKGSSEQRQIEKKLQRVNQMYYQSYKNSTLK